MIKIVNKILSKYPLNYLLDKYYYKDIMKKYGPKLKKYWKTYIEGMRKGERKYMGSSIIFMFVMLGIALIPRGILAQQEIPTIVQVIAGGLTVVMAGIITAFSK